MGMNQISGNKSSKNATNTTNSNMLQVEKNKKKSIEEKIKEIGNYLNTLVKDFEFIEYTPDRVSFQGDGQNMVVYSINGKIPNYFFYKGDKMSFRVYDVRNNWYILIANLR